MIHLSRNPENSELFNFFPIFSECFLTFLSDKVLEICLFKKKNFELAMKSLMNSTKKKNLTNPRNMPPHSH